MVELSQEKKDELFIFSSPAARLRHIMRWQGCKTDYQLAEKLKMARSTLRSVLDRDRIGRPTAQTIAEKLDLDFLWVFQGIGEPPRLSEDEAGVVVSPEIWDDSASFGDGFVSPQWSPQHSPAARLRYVMEVEDLGSISALCSAADVSIEGLRNVFATDTIDDELARQLSISLHYSFEWLRHGEGKPTKRGAEIAGFLGHPADPNAQPLIGPAETPTIPGNDTAPSFVLIPRAKAEVSGGGGLIPEEGDTDEQYAFRLDWLKAIRATLGYLKIVQVDGQSMSPKIEHRDLILVDLKRTKPLDGKIFVIDIAGSAVVKELEFLPGPKFKLKSANKSFESPIEYQENVRIVGQVIWVGRSLL